MDNKPGKIRRRGRPRKTQTIPLSKSKNKKTEDEEIILEMPINMSDIRKYCPDMNSDDSGNESPCVFALNELSTSNKDDRSNHHLLVQLADKDVIIDKLKKEVANLKEVISENGLYGINSTKVYEMDLKLINLKDGKQLVAKKTDIACWWCTYQFDNVPFFLPDKYIDGTYHVFGCFCDPSCAAAYNFKKINDYKVSERYSLINKMYKEVSGNDDVITVADDREILEKFGGPVSIEKYRKSASFRLKKYRLIIPPMTSVVPLIEERIVNGQIRRTYDNSMKNNFGYKLKRSKPLPNKHNTLIETMGLRIKKK